MVQIPVSFDAGKNTGIALYTLTAGQLILTLREAGSLFPVPGGSRTIDVAAGQQISAFVTQFLPDVKATSFTGRLTIESRSLTGAGQLSVLGLQFNGVVAPVTISVLQ